MKIYFMFILIFLPFKIFACQDYAPWQKVNKDCKWTKFSESAIQSSILPTLIPTDISKFCPKYSKLNMDEKNKFWVTLISAIARPESNYDPKTTYTEKFVDAHGNYVISRGLLQISIESANQKLYSCQIKKAEDLHTPETNIQCGIKILSALVKKDNSIASYTSTPVGGAKYWSVLRSSKGHLPEITGNTKKLTFCQ